MPPGYTFCGLRRTTLPGTSVNIDQRYHGSKHEVKGTSARWLLLAVNFGELPYGEVRRILLLGTGVKIALAAAPFHGFGVARQGPWITWVNSPLQGRSFSVSGFYANAQALPLQAFLVELCQLLVATLDWRLARGVSLPHDLGGLLEGHARDDLLEDHYHPWHRVLPVVVQDDIPGKIGLGLTSSSGSRCP